MGVALAIASSAVLSTALFIVVAMALAGFARVHIESATFGSGPRVVSFRVGSTAVNIRAVPTHGYVEPLGAKPVDDPAQPIPQPPSSRLLWLEAPPWRRALAFAIAPRLAALLLASLPLGPERAGRAAAEGIWQIVRGASSPFGVARELLQVGADVLAREGFVVLGALALCKWVSLGMLTLPTDLAYAAGRQHSQRLAIARAALMIALLLVHVAWAIGWIAWMARSS